MNKLLIVLALLLSTPLYSQLRVKPRPADVESADAIIAALYGAISGPAGQERDWDRLRSLFTREARLMNVFKNQDGLTGMVTMTVEDYIKRVERQFRENGFFERELSRKTDRFGLVTQVFSTYESRQEKDGPVISRGINSIQMVEHSGRFWIANILWNNETKEYPIPAQYLQPINQRAENHEGETILVGRIDRAGLQQEPFGAWFNEGYAGYEADKTSLQEIKESLPGVDILAFMGTWCSDSQREVPHFFKILDHAGYDLNGLQLVALSNHPDNYKQSPQHEEQGWNIEYVPTFIFLKNGKELGRIVESPDVSLEKDLRKILTGK
ncbi:MAG: thioredoxin family protein [Phaeodactylibacter sp.]|nr:thioredoxin family protein [Phaeodactylibacter sp.]